MTLPYLEELTRAEARRARRRRWQAIGDVLAFLALCTVFAAVLMGATWLTFMLPWD